MKVTPAELVIVARSLFKYVQKISSNIMEPLLNHNYFSPVSDFVKSVAPSVNTDREHTAESRDKNRYPLPASDSTLNEQSQSQRSLQDGTGRVKKGIDINDSLWSSQSALRSLTDMLIFSRVEPAFQTNI